MPTSYLPRPLELWKELPASEGARSTLSFYHSDALSPLPVRDVTRVGDNKADPNLETGTYGLFSTCQARLRSLIVREQRSKIFFVTNRRGVRVLTGYYHLGWYAPLKGAGGEIALAASEVHFVETPVSLSDAKRITGADVDSWFRLNRPITPTEASGLTALLHRQPNATSDYVAEIHRLEHINLRFGGHRYVGRGRDESYSWDEAHRFIRDLGDKSREVTNGEARNSSPSEWWNCNSCSMYSTNKARLRECPHCGEVNTLIPMDHSPDH